jgi:AraC-like DNA-binding protein
MPKDVADTPKSEPSEAASDLDRSRPVLVLDRSRGGGHVVEPHAHPRAQLAWPTTGVLRIVVGDDVFIVPPSHAVWIPGGRVHQMITETDAEIRHLLIHPERGTRPGGGDPATCCVVAMTPLLREAILRMGEFDRGPTSEARLARLGEVILDEIADLPAAPLGLPGGRDPRLVRLTRHLENRPADGRPLAELASLVGSTTRTLERLIHAETGLTYRQWRARHRLLRSIERLEAGESTTAVALSLGYAGASAFAAAFRRHFGVTPQHYRGDLGRRGSGRRRSLTTTSVATTADPP